MLICEQLYNEILIKPAEKGGDSLYIVSGYSTATMASKHLEDLKNLKKNVKIELIVGMFPQDGIHEKDHKGFIQLAEKHFPANLNCRYLINPSPVHSKVYSWFKGRNPFAGFSGSANYTQRPFIGKQKEIMSPVKAQEGLRYFKSILMTQSTAVTARPDNMCIHLKEKRF